MKKVVLFLACVLMMAASMSLKAQEITVTLLPGWTWISYTRADTLDIATAMGSFTPAEGDMIKSQYGFTIYSNGQWSGGLTEFVPGLGYMYNSKRLSPVMLSFNSQQPIPQVVVTTDAPQLITAVSAMGGGEVTTTDGTYIIVKGLCWATHENPTTNDDFYEEAESGVGTFSISMTELNIATTYYVRAYAVTPNGTVYGDQKSFTTKDGIPDVSTDSVTMVFCHEVSCFSTITDDGGLTVIASGVCWSTSPNPTVTDNHTYPDSYVSNSFICYITGLDESTTYYVRAYASTRQGTGYGEEISFTTQNSSVGLYIDLGLPSGTLWGMCNVGADTPENYGNYYAWGETEPLSLNNHYLNVDYLQGEYINYELTKYCNNSNFGYNGFTDNLTILLPEDDAATANLGDDFRMPTNEDWQELYQNTACIWTTQNGVNGMLFTAANGNTLFLPAGGDWYWDNITWSYYYEPNGVSSNGYYWSSSLNTDNPINAKVFNFSTDCYDIGSNFRNFGMSVRPVRCKNSEISVSSNPIEGGSVSGEGTYMDHTTCTLTATAYDGFVFTYWTENGNVVSADAVYTFVVNGNRSLVANYVNTSSAVHSYVDLGLPSGLLWATCNIGAYYPEGYGDYFAWGETTPKDTYNWSTYQYCMGSSSTLTKYCNKSNYGYYGFTDNLTTLLPEDDAATANWGSDWRMPTKEEWQELHNNTTHTWTTQNCVYGMLFTASNGNSLFLPAAGGRYDSDLFEAGSFGGYRSSSLGTDDPINSWNLIFNSGYYEMVDGNRSMGRSVRAVRSASQN